jgi:hypothetical protein
MDIDTQTLDLAERIGQLPDDKKRDLNALLDMLEGKRLDDDPALDEPDPYIEVPFTDKELMKAHGQDSLEPLECAAIYAVAKMVCYGGFTRINLQGSADGTAYEGLATMIRDVHHALIEMKQWHREL